MKGKRASNGGQRSGNKKRAPDFQEPFGLSQQSGFFGQPIHLLVIAFIPAGGEPVKGFPVSLVLAS